MKNIIYISIAIFSLSLEAKSLSDNEVVDKYIPLEMVNAIDTDSNPPKKVDRAEIDRKFIIFDYGSKDGSKILLATYNTNSLSVENPISKTLAIKIEKSGKTSLIKAPDGTDDYAIDEKSDVTLSDINNDGIKEIVVSDSDDKGKYQESHILKWNGKTFEEIKFQLTERESTLLSELDLEALPLLVYKDVLESKEEKLHKIKQMKTNGSLVDLGTFNFAKIISKETEKLEERQYDIEDVSEGQYTLEVKNLSKHQRPVRAEISINNVVVLKPTDFGNRKPKYFEKQNADVNLKSKGNELKVKLYGNKNSKIQITLKKKN